jgi:hypothetical protein
VLLAIVPTYYVHNYEVPCKNWDLGSTFPLKTDKSTMLNGIWSMDQNASRFDKVCLRVRHPDDSRALPRQPPRLRPAPSMSSATPQRLPMSASETDGKFVRWSVR